MGGGGIRILLWVAVQSKRLLNNNFQTCTVAYAMLFVQHRLPTWPIYISACTCCCCGISVQHKESRKLKVILFEFLLHKCGEFECAKLQMQSITKYICEVFPFSLYYCMHWKLIKLLKLCSLTNKFYLNIYFNLKIYILGTKYSAVFLAVNIQIKY